MIFDNDKMLIHGGINDKDKTFSDAFILVGLHSDLDIAQSEIKHDVQGHLLNFDELRSRKKKGKLEMLQWFKCEQEGDVPSARDSHSVTIANN